MTTNQNKILDSAAMKFGPIIVVLVGVVYAVALSVAVSKNPVKIPLGYIESISYIHEDKAAAFRLDSDVVLIVREAGNVNISIGAEVNLSKKCVHIEEHCFIYYEVREDD